MLEGTKENDRLSTLGFTTRGLAVDLALATGRAVTDLCQYINSDLVFSDLKFGPLCSEIVTHIFRKSQVTSNVFHVLSHGEIHFLPSVSSKNL